MNKASGGDEIPAELFQILKDAVKVLHSILNLENSAMTTGLEKVSFHPNLRKAMPKNAPTATQLHSSHTTAK